jgi:hypothetical protein
MIPTSTTSAPTPRKRRSMDRAVRGETALQSANSRVLWVARIASAMRSANA